MQIGASLAERQQLAKLQEVDQLMGYGMTRQTVRIDPDRRFLTGRESRGAARQTDLDADSVQLGEESPNLLHRL